MTANYLAYLLLVPLVATVLQMLFLKKYGIQRAIFIVSGLVYSAVVFQIARQVGVSGSLVLSVGGWATPFSIALFCDALSLVMISVVALIMLSVGLASEKNPDQKEGRTLFFPVVNALLLGVTLAFITADIFNLYVSFELMLIASYVLLTMRSQRSEVIGSISYILINIVGSGLFLIGVTILYRITGTLSVAGIAQFIGQNMGNHAGYKEALSISAFLFACVFGIKSAVFPLGVWLPYSYRAPNIVVSALFAGLLTKVGVYCFVRFFPLLFGVFLIDYQMVFMPIAIITMFVGVLGAVAQDDLRALLSFHIVSQIGYMLAIFAVATPLALVITVFYMLHNILAKTNLFYIAGILERKTGQRQLSKMGNMMKNNSFLVVSFLVSAFALAGIPPLSGFWGKVMIVKELLSKDFLWVALASTFCSLLTMFSMFKIWNEAFLKESPSGDKEEVQIQGPTTGLYLANSLLLVGILSLSFLFVYASGFLDLLRQQLAEPQFYIQAILGGTGG